MNQFFWSQKERSIYDQEYKDELDAKAILEDAEERGRVESRYEAFLEFVFNMHGDGKNIQEIASATKLHPHQIENMIKSQSTSRQGQA